MTTWEEKCVSEILTVITYTRDYNAVGGLIPLFTANYKEAVFRVNCLKKYIPLNEIIPKLMFEGIELVEENVFNGEPHYSVKLMMVNSIVH